MPYFMAYPMMDGMDAEEKNQRDYEYMRQMYPKRLQRIKDIIEDECDKLEYEGSMMFDEYPDRLSLLQLCKKIEEQAQGLDMQEVYEAMQRRPGADRPPQWRPEHDREPEWGHGRPPHHRPPHHRPPRQDNWLGDIIQGLLFDEVHRRRCRYRNGRCRRW
ncbi:MAG: hypothetical protein J6J86_00275 [Lachnospiraceae bacterium]|nr:hypothetical protein [Lachnospiraceae bacterium]